ncbi:MAG TPA: aminotransferase class V-fold PLP-dependent enzyme [Gemmatimonadales bacterium]|nr:aminotransferase class V-fold PLP-dependent enzyme [Gemmatimonadales bacterium]
MSEPATAAAPIPGVAAVARWRQETPGCAGRIHLNNAGAAFAPIPVLEAVRSHLELEQQLGGYEAAEAAASRIAGTYASVAQLVGGAARNIAVVENATVAFAQAMSSIDFRTGDVIVTTRNDYISSQLLFLSLARRLGVRILRAADLATGGSDPDSVRDLARHPRCRLVSVTWIPTNSGLIQPVETIGEICEELAVPYLVDACQAAGHLPIDVARLRCDFLSATARKFLRGPRGVGFLYVSDRALERGSAPLFIDMRGASWTAPDEYRLAPDARRFENWEFAVALLLGLGAAAGYALREGMDLLSERALALAAYARRRLAVLPGVRLLDRGPRLGAILTAEIAGRSAEDVVGALRERGINTNASLREYAVIDMDAKGAQSAVRISPHYYNTTGEIDALADALAEITAG